MEPRFICNLNLQGKADAWTLLRQTGLQSLRIRLIGGVQKARCGVRWSPIS